MSNIRVVIAVFILIVCWFLSPSASRAQSFTNTGSLKTARSGQTSTLLSTGNVLVTGGSCTGNGCSVLSSAEVYVSSAGAFATTGSLHTARHWHTATLLNNGMVLIVGGHNFTNGILSSAELYNPATGAFTVTGSLATARANHTATLLSNGMVLVTGGISCTNCYLSSSELYNPSTGTFTSTGSLNAARTHHTATLLNNGMVLVAGGGTSSVLASAELYNPSTGTFGVTGSLNSARFGHTATLLDSGLVLVAGGQNCPSGFCGGLSGAELFSPSNGSFAVTGNLNTGRFSHTATLLTNGTVLVSAGATSCGIDVGCAPTSSAELYSAGSGTFALTSSLNAARYSHTGTLLNNGKVLVSGGFGSSGLLSTAELYQPASLTPSGLLSITLGQSNPWVPIGSFLNIIPMGNFSGGTQTLAAVSWSSSNNAVATVTNDSGSSTTGDSVNRDNALGVASGSATISACAGTVCGSTVVTVAPHSNLLIGGAPGAGGTFEKYDDSGTLLANGNLSSPRSMHSATLLKDGHIFVAGGVSDETSWGIFDQNGSVLSSGLLNDGRSSSGATLLGNGNVFLEGGVTGVPGVGSSTWEIHNPAGSLVASGNLNDQRGSGSSVVTLQNGNVWISGGSLGSGGACDYEIRNSSGALVTSGVLTSCFPGGQVQVLSNGNVMLIGGDSAPGTFEIRTQTGSLVSTSSLTNGFNHGMNSVVLNNGNIFIFGSCQVGRHDEPDPKDPSNTDYSWSCGTIGAPSTWEIRDVNGNFVSTGSLFDQRDGAGAVVLSNGSIFITGGNQALGTWEIRSASGVLISQGSLFNGDGGGHTLTHF